MPPINLLLSPIDPLCPQIESAMALRSQDGRNVLPSGTVVPFTRAVRPHLGAIPTLILPMHTESGFLNTLG